VRAKVRAITAIRLGLLASKQIGFADDHAGGGGENFLIFL
jgi:hypothetical protein